MDYSITKICYIIGKGPSLNILTVEDFEPGCSIFCINESIHKIYSLGLSNPIFCVTQDIGLGDRCKIKGPVFLIGDELRQQYANHPNTYLIGMIAPKYTSILAMYFAKKHGCNHFRMLAFDACITGKLGYASIIGKSPNGDPRRFLTHRKTIEKYTNRLKLEWVIPKAQPSEASDILQQ